MKTAIQEINEITPKETEAIELQLPLLRALEVSFPFFPFLLEDTIPFSNEELSEILQENNTGIEKKVKKGIVEDENGEQEEYAKDITYDTENSYNRKNTYSPRKDYERIEHLKVKEEEEEKSFLWK